MVDIETSGPTPTSVAPSQGAGDDAAPWSRAWWSDRLAGGAWALLAVLWVLIAVWALRLGEAVSALWALTAGLHLLLVGSWPVLFIGLVGRRRALAAAAVITIMAQVVVAWPLRPHVGGTADGPHITLASLNLFVDNPKLAVASREIVASAPDILVLQEVTPEAVAALHRAGILRRMPHAIERAEPGTAGEAVYSRYPLHVLATPPGVDDVVSVAATLPGGHRLRIFDVHEFGPQPGDPGVWGRQLHHLDRALGRVRAPWVSIGDYNASFDHRTYRDLLHGGRHDAHLATGRGYARSWPADEPFPAVLLIDHALLSPGVAAQATRERTIAGSDHRMIEVDLRS